MRKFNLKRIVSILGSVLTVAALFFLFHRFNQLRGEIDLEVFSSPTTVLFLIVIAIVIGLGIITEGLNYRALIKDFSGVSFNRARAILIFTYANLYKYIPPGGIMYAAGRNRLAVENKELSHAKVLLATATEAVISFLAALTVISVLVFEYALTLIRTTDIFNATLIFVTITSLVLLIALLCFIFRKRLTELYNNLVSGPHKIKFFNILKRYGVMLVLVTALSFSFTGVMFVIGQEMTLNLAVTISGLFMLSWLIGFLTPGAPSGLGVRELVILMFIGGLVSEMTLLTAMVVHRLLAILGDLIAHGIALTYARVARSE